MKNEPSIERIAYVRRTYLPLVLIAMASIIIVSLTSGIAFPHERVTPISATTTFRIIGAIGLVLVMAGKLFKRWDIPLGEAILLMLVSDLSLIRDSVAHWGWDGWITLLATCAIIPIGLLMIYAWREYWDDKPRWLPIANDAYFVLACAFLLFVPLPASWWPDLHYVALLIPIVMGLGSGLIISNSFPDLWKR